MTFGVERSNRDARERTRELQTSIGELAVEKRCLEGALGKVQSFRGNRLSTRVGAYGVTRGTAVRSFALGRVLPRPARCVVASIEMNGATGVSASLSMIHHV